jgi:hypothetical protein
MHLGLEDPSIGNMELVITLGCFGAKGYEDLKRKCALSHFYIGFHV